MTEQILGALRQITSPIRPWYVLASVVALAAMVIAIEFGSNWVLNFVHVMCGGLWTGIDLFMGFVIGPILRRLPLEARRAVIAALVPRTLFLMPTLSIITATSGWFLAERTGFLDLNYPGRGLARHCSRADGPRPGISLADKLAHLFRASEADAESCHGCALDAGLLRRRRLSRSDAGRHHYRDGALCDRAMTDIRLSCA